MDRSSGALCRVAITGLGPISSIGIGHTEFSCGLRAGKSGAKPISSFPTDGFDHAMACEIHDVDPVELVRNITAEEYGRSSLFAGAAARMAVDDAGIDDFGDTVVLVAIGTTDGESRDLDDIARDRARGVTTVPADRARRIPAANLSLAVAQELGLSDAEIITLPTACAAGNYAIGYGYDAVRLGEIDLALCGGADSVCQKTFAGFYRLGTVAPDACRPFDAERKGILTGEGAGVVVLESWDRAIARGAKIYAEIVGFGLNCDADHPVAPNEERISQCMRKALDEAALSPADISLVSAHGTGTKANDVTESRAIHTVFADPPPTISIKSMIGHTMGAASALASIACCIALTDNFIPPTINHRVTDPECDIDCVPNTAIAAELAYVQNNGLAFGGNNAVLVFASATSAGVDER